VDPARVHEARIEAGLSLGQLAGDDVSRTFIHFVEQGKSRPSKGVLSLIARRTGKPMSYFIQQPSNEQQRATDLVAEMTAVATRIRRFVVLNRLTKAEQEAMKLVELTVLQGAALTKAIANQKERSNPP
jgi:transcriptional regulator with XRE-family HTH domain